ncbi:uncharacterized protein B0H18DRAFT_1020610, partial [Fomitopsis serialis]|uniref:uncharacterized protein n=1 Tax=Fomitopsis serialis TaxID=139415 RepID=UPI002008C7F4
MHRLSVPTLSQIPSLSGSSGSGSIPPSGLCTPSDDGPMHSSAGDVFSKALSGSMEDLFATPRQQYGLPASIDDADTAIAVSPPAHRRRRPENRPRPESPSSTSAKLDEAQLEVSSDLLLASLHAPDHNPPTISTEPWTPRRVLSVTIKILFFLPWCVAVGGAILLSPQHLELVAFRTGYVSHERGPHRSALGRYGTWAVAAMLARGVYVWHDFRVDLTVPLGEDDRQSLYLALT